MLEDIKAIAELKPSGIIHIAVFPYFHKLYKFYLFGGVLLLGRQPLVQKAPIYRLISKSIQFIFTNKFQIVFLFLFCFARTSNVHF